MAQTKKASKKPATAPNKHTTKELNRQNEYTIKGDENHKGPFKWVDDKSDDGRHKEYRPFFNFPIRDARGIYPNTQKIGSRQITVYWDEHLGGLAFKYPCGDIKLFEFHGEHSFDDWIETLITLEMEARPRHHGLNGDRLKARIKEKLERYRGEIDNANASIQHYEASITHTNTQITTTNDALVISQARFDNIQTELDTAIDLYPPETITTANEPDTATP